MSRLDLTSWQRRRLRRQLKENKRGREPLLRTTPPPAAPPAAPANPLAPVLVTGPDAGSAPWVKVFDARGKLVSILFS